MNPPIVLRRLTVLKPIAVASGIHVLYFVLQNQKCHFNVCYKQNGVSCVCFHLYEIRNPIC